MKAKRSKAIREGDRVRVVIPQVVTRVGYPKEVGDYLDAARRAYGEQLSRDMNDRCREKALRQIAYGFAQADGFGGRERTLHLKEVSDLVGVEFTVTGVRMVQTGTYYPPRASVSYCGEHDYEPGGLENMKARRLLRGVTAKWALAPGVLTVHHDAEIPVEHVELV